MLNHALAIGLLALSACQEAPANEPAKGRAIAPQATVTTQPLPASSSVLERLPDVAERTVKSVVNIATEKTVTARGMTPFDADPFFNQFFGNRMPQERREQSRGSGVIVDSSGLILTNNHVVGGADEIQITLSDGRSFEATVVGTDSHTDVAVVRLVDPPQDLVPLPYGDSDALRLGEVVLAIGNPFGIGQTVTMGIVSATGRSDLGIVDYENFIQTDAAINPGNSGGALVNMNGELVGINTAIISGSGGYQGIGFAVPSQMVRTIADDLLEDGKVSRGFLGVSIQDIDESLAAAMDLKKVNQGVIIGHVSRGSAADKAGMRVGDVVLEFNGRPVRDVRTFRLAVADAGADQPFKALILRDGKRRKLSGTLGALDQDEAEPVAQSEGGDQALGLTLNELTSDAIRQLDIPQTIRGVLVRGVDPGSPAQRVGIQPGDVILEVNRRKVSTLSDVTKALGPEDKDVLLLIYRNRVTQFVVIPR